jgi:NADPH-dependent curcumin reductase CurA
MQLQGRRNFLMAGGIAVATGWVASRVWRGPSSSSISPSAPPLGSALNLTSREIHLKRRPVGLPSPQDFELVVAPVPPPNEGQILVRNLYMSVDPYMRGPMSDLPSYIPPFRLGEVLSGQAIGRVEVSKSPLFKAGDFVKSNYGWREWYMIDGAAKELEKETVDPAFPIQSHIGPLGLAGFAAYIGLTEIGAVKSGDRLFISGASGAVGSVACQIAKIKGCWVVGSAGSDEECDYLVKDLGVDKAFNYKTCGDVTAAVAKAAPEGIDCYFDNVGGSHLQAAIENMRNFGRIIACGMISEYNNTKPDPSPTNLIKIISKRITMRGFIAADHADLRPAFIADMIEWKKQGKMKWRETIVDGIENSPQAFINLFTGHHIGKMLVRLGPEGE